MSSPTFLMASVLKSLRLWTLPVLAVWPWANYFVLLSIDLSQNTPKFSSLEQHILSLTVSKCWEYGNRLVELFRLMRFQSNCWLKSLKYFEYLLSGSLTWVFVGGFRSMLCGPLHMSAYDMSGEHTQDKGHSLFIT